MIRALLLGFSLFSACWLLHVLIWRIKRPVAYPIWLPIIFFFVPIAGALIEWRMPLLPRLDMAWYSVSAGALLHTAISACYMGGYAGVIEYSPSAEILRVVRESMPDGIRPEDLNVTSLSEQALTGKRVSHLVDSRMASIADGKLRLTPRGAMVVALCDFYRRVFGIQSEAMG